MKLLLAVLGVILVPAVLFVAGGSSPEVFQAACEREGQLEREVEGAEKGPCGESLAEVGRELQEPADVMLTRQLFGSDRGLTPSQVFRSARRASGRIAQATRERAPGIAAARWSFEGPTNIGGRILDLAIDPAQVDVVYAASASGGVFKSTDAGRTWQSSWPEDLPQAIGAVAMTPSGVLYAGTGEAGPGGGGITYGGDGVYRSDDRGRTWRNIGLKGTSRISRIVLDPSDEQRIFVAATGPLFEAGGERGLYRTDDGGATWKLVLEGDNPTTGATDIAIDPRDPKRVYAAMWDHIREPDRRAYEGVGSGLYRSDDGGDTWRRIGGGLFGPNPALGRIGIALAPSNPDHLYAIATGPVGAAAGFFSSTDAGATFVPTQSPELLLASYTYGWWFGRVWVDPADEDKVYVAGVQLVRSEDGGMTFADASQGSHADHHAMVWDARQAGRLYLGNDGGVYRSDDNGESYEFAESMPWSQLWTFDVDEQDPTRFVAGLQDNGCNRSWGGGVPGEWTNYGCGDGLRTLIRPDKPTTVYGCSQYGACSINREDGDPDANESFEYEVISSRKNWLTPIEFDPENPDIVYTGGEIVSRSEDDAASWTPISPDLTNGPGRETNPLFRNYGTVTSLSPGPRESGTIYAGTDDGNLQYTHDAGLTWTNAATGDSGLPEAWVTRVQIDPQDPKVAYVAYSGFRAGDDAAYVLRTRDGGASWENLTGDLPRAPVNDINLIGGDLVVATDLGVFLTRDDGRSWLRVGAGLPLVPVHELRWHAPSKQLFIATFGRGIYKLDYTAIDRAQVAPATPRKRRGLGLPARRRCGRALSFKVRGATSFRSLTLRVNGRKAATVKGAKLRRKIRVALPRRSVRLQAVAVRKAGGKVKQTRRYAACGRKR
jgi:photosystem II stability/assembly factor-like uncharacterized protein